MATVHKYRLNVSEAGRSVEYEIVADSYTVSGFGDLTFVKDIGAGDGSNPVSDSQVKTYKAGTWSNLRVTHYYDNGTAGYVAYDVSTDETREPS